MKLLTPPGVAGVAVVRVEPADYPQLLLALRKVDGGVLFLEPEAPPCRAVLQIDGVMLDEVLVVAHRTRGIEIHTHGSPAVLEALRQTFGMTPSEASSPAEQLLRQAASVGQLALAVEQMEWSFSHFCRDIVLLPHEEMVRQLIASRCRSRVARAQWEPQRLVLVGSQNAGKSSLFNLLLFRERALTGPQPGLTRDPVAECAILDGYPYEIVDTAGEGPVSSSIDERALVRAREYREEAMLLLVIDRSVGVSAADRELAARASLIVSNKNDLRHAAVPWPDDVPRHLQVSCSEGDGALIRSQVGGWLRLRRGLPAAGRVGGVAALTVAQASLLEEVERSTASGGC